MRIPSHKTTSQTIEVTAADAVAAKLPYQARLSGGWYRTRAVCHGGDSPDSLAFRDSDHDGGELRVHCHSGGCDPTAIRHAIQEATGLQVCRCDDCWAAWRAGESLKDVQATTSRQNRPKHDAGSCSTSKPKNSPQGHSRPADSKDTRAYAAELWATAPISTTGPAPHHPVAKWLAERGLWPAGEPLPEAVRWLARDNPRFPRGQPDSAAAGALVMAMRPLDNPTTPPRKIQLIAIDKGGVKTYHWPDRGDKRTYGSGPAYGLLWRGDLQVAAYTLHICEGLADGLRILRYAADPALVAICAGTAYTQIVPGYFNSLTLWPTPTSRGSRQRKRQASYGPIKDTTFGLCDCQPDMTPPAHHYKERKVMKLRSEYGTNGRAATHANGIGGTEERISPDPLSEAMRDLVRSRVAGDTAAIEAAGDKVRSLLPEVVWDQRAAWALDDADIADITASFRSGSPEQQKHARGPDRDSVGKRGDESPSGYLGLELCGAGS